ncbi:uridine diphosphate-N-acetylglucosamine-binding protein YvcK [Nakamurella sp. A5-74]|uniref:Putative gluconeogenesis factor n=1 Tax=Nakamurella sp. A5-74 TaxID=3158264 RepID=A0AAU8DXU0_9ACTN
MTSDHSRFRVVALGGGHGLYAMLTALVELDVDITAVVTVADDGGSSGRLRREIDGSLPPGDLRMALAALADPGPDGALWQRAFQHRFSGDGALAGHPVGNLVLTGLAELLDDPVAALDAAGRLLGARGRVLPMSGRPLEIVGRVAGLEDDVHTVRRIRGQVAVASTPGQVLGVSVEPADAIGCPEAIAAVRDADLVILGPGSWFTSVLPHLLLPDLGEAVITTPAHRLVVLNLAPQPGETEGFSPGRHLDVLREHVPALTVDTVLVDVEPADSPDAPPSGSLTAAAERLGGRVLEAAISEGPGIPRHDPHRLAAALRTVIAGCVCARATPGTATAPDGRRTPAPRPTSDERENENAWR